MSYAPARTPGGVKRKGPTTKPKPKTKKVPVQDPVEVYCRIRPLRDITDITCVRKYNETTVVLCYPNSNKDMLYTFKHVFTDRASQKDVFDEIALPLVNDVVNGKDSLLFTYGITSSGKTHTITGSSHDNGVLPRCLDVIFNSIDKSQSRKFIFKPDGQNFFEIKSTPDALLEWQRERELAASTPVINSKTRQQRKREIDENKGWEARIKDTCTVNLVKPDNAFAVFVSYVEIYNNYIYDLLDESIIDSLKVKHQQPQSKSLREDNRRKVYINKLSEIEVKSSDEAFELFVKGIRRRRIAHTVLNTESSRSHSVFNIRVVQGPKDPDGEVIQDSRFMSVSQLSLVDLAGSERTGRTGNKGERLREAGNINNSLMTLRSCIEILRDNQKNFSNKIVPYRDTKLTYLFKSYLEGEGKIKMIICVNPGGEDFDETLHVMKFAEVSQEVMINRHTTMPLQYIGNMPEFYEKINFGLRSSVPLPTSLFTDPEDDKVIPAWLDFFETKRSAKRVKIESLKQAQFVFRQHLAQAEQEYITMNQQMSLYKTDLEGREHQIKLLESKCNQLERTHEIQQKKIFENDKKLKILERELADKNRELNKAAVFMERMKEDANDRLLHEQYRMKETFNRLLTDKQSQLERQECVFREKMDLVREIFNSDNSWDVVKNGIQHHSSRYSDFVRSKATPTAPFDTASNNTRSKKKFERCTSEPRPSPRKPIDTTMALRSRATIVSKVASEVEHEKPTGLPVVNPRHRRSLSTGNEKWIDHRPSNPLPLGTVMQPKIKNKKSISNLKELGTQNLKSASNYALTHHTAKPDGDVETSVYKGPVLPTSAGGAQVIFQDVETLKQSSPTGRKRSVNDAETKIVQDFPLDECLQSPEFSKRSRY